MLYFLFSGETGYFLNHLGVLAKIWLGENALLYPIMFSLLAIAFFLAYLLGSINTAVIVSSRMYADDVRTHGSKNAGFANMMRNYGAKAAYYTLAGDALKTILAVLIGWVLYGYMGAVTAGFGCLLGHIFPIFYRFKGGKGVVCFAATVFVLDWRMFLIGIGVFVVTLAVTKYISFASVLSSMTLPLFMNRMYRSALVIGTESERLIFFSTFIAIAAAFIIVIKHLPNFKRIFSGTESKFEFKKTIIK